MMKTACVGPQHKCSGSHRGPLDLASDEQCLELVDLGNEKLDIMNLTPKPPQLPGHTPTKLQLPQMTSAKACTQEIGLAGSITRPKAEHYHANCIYTDPSEPLTKPNC